MNADWPDMKFQALHLIAICRSLWDFLHSRHSDRRHPHLQPMAIMNVVWPVTGLYAGPIALLGLFSYGRPAKG